MNNGSELRVNVIDVNVCPSDVTSACLYPSIKDWSKEWWHALHKCIKCMHVAYGIMA